MRGQLAVALLLATVLAGCGAPESRDPGSQAIPRGQGGVLGNVVTTGDQQPLQGVDVVVLPAGGAFTTNGQGKFDGHLAPGRYTAHASLPGYEGAPQPFDVVSGNYTEIVIFMERTKNR